MAFQPPRTNFGLTRPFRLGHYRTLALTLALCAASTIPSAFGQGPPAPPVQPPAQFESGSVSITQANADTWLWVPFTRTFAKPPVVVMGPSTRNDTSPAIITAVDVYTNGFYCQVNEWEYLDGPHSAETAHFFALTEGTHNFGGQIWHVGKVPAVNRAATSVSLTGFTSTPVVLTQVGSYNNWTSLDGVQAVKTRVSAVTSADFQVQLETQEASAGSAINSESVNFIAVSQGTGYLDGKILSAVRTGAGTTQNLAAVTFPASRTNPILVAQTQTINDTNPGELKMASLSSTSVQLMFQEETSANTDVTHTAEEVGYIVLGDMSGEVTAKLEIGDITVTQASATTWTTVNLANSYTTPVVVMGPLSYTGGTSLTVRVRSVTSTSFQFQVDRWDHHGTQAHNSLEKLSYMVIESGTYAIGGARWQAGRHSAVTPAGVTQALGAGFAATPVVFSQVATTNDTAAVQSRVSNVSTSGFTLELDESEITPPDHAAEQVHWIAISQGVSNLFSTGMRLQAGAVNNVDSSFRTVPFSRMHADPFLFASMQSKIDADPATLRWRYLFADKVELVAQEDAHPAQPGEGTVSNTHSAETVAFLTVQGAQDTDSDGAPDDWENSVGLNANNSSDGSLDPDADLLTNQQEFHNRLNFTTSTMHNAFTGGVVTVGNAVTSGYEVNDVTANPLVSTQPRFRVYRNGGFAPITINITMAGTATTDTNRAPASSADYTAWTGATTGTQVTSTIALGTNAQSVDIYVRPVIDNLNEYTEGLRLTANAGSYTLGTTTSTVVLIYDAMDIPANQKLFVGTFLPQSGVTSSASGFATVILNGPNTAAKISTTFNGLTTPQTDIDGSHVHFMGGTIVYGEPDGLPNGQLIEYPWTIVDSAGYKAQRLIDALYHLNSEHLYVNVHTDRYTGGEIRAELFRVDAGPFVTPSAPPALENLANDEQVRRECVRFLTQATFGASQADVDALFNSISSPKTTASNRITAFTNWINNQWTLDQTSLYDYHRAANNQEWALWGQQPNLPAVVDNPATTTVNETYPAAPPPNNPVDWTRWGATPSPAGAWTYRPVPPGLNKESYDPDHNNRRRGWWSIANRAHDQLRQRVGFALEEIFIISDREGTVQTRTFGHSRYYDMLGDHVDSVRNVYPASPTAAYASPPNLLTGYTSGSATNLRDLLEDVSKSPMMGKYLSHLQNQKAQYADTNGSGILGDTVGGVPDEVILSPDENYAREIMQLFSIGLLMLHPDGSIQIGAGGQPIATYDNDDIKELSRVFTGWSFAWAQGSAASGYAGATAQTNFFGSAGTEYFHPGYETPMKNFVAYHDEGSKVVLGATLPAYTGSSSDTAAREAYSEAELDSTLNILFNHQNIAPFISRLLIQRLVTSNPSRGYVYRVAQVFNDSNGATAGGVRGSIKDVVKAILLDYEARSLTFVDPQNINGNISVNVGYGKVKEPLVRYLQVLRAFNARSQIDFDEPSPDVNDLAGYGYPAGQLNNLGTNPTRFRFGDTVSVIGQTPNNMPSVFNWFLPDYSPGGRVAAAGLYAPELQILGENMVVSNINYHRTIDYNAIFDTSAAIPGGQGVSNLLGDTGGLLDNINIDASALTTEYKANRDAGGATNVSAATFLVDKLDALLCAGSLKAKYGAYSAGGEDPRSVIIDQLALISPTTTIPLPINNAGARVRAALYLVTMTPEFIVQK